MRTGLANQQGMIRYPRVASAESRYLPPLGLKGHREETVLQEPVGI